MEQTPASGGAGGGTSTRPYLIRALHDWCTDNGFTPYIAVHVDRSVQVPMEYVSNHEIVLNIGFDATSGLDLGNDFIQFKARFGGVAREIIVPVDHVVAIYARENGQGMAFPAPEPLAEGAATGAAPQPAGPAPQEPRRSGLRLASEASDDEGDDAPPPPDAPSGGPRPSLKRVK
ncbi:ClpXP protease specificity-enhancing factor [Roseateles sp.]|uniref:ClpXP protease specificity-enhancing factor n=1 Tax=Roseateles sp. TaxID=1971397 RepID=UPI0039EC7D4A